MIRIRITKYGFMLVTSQILNTEIYNLETRKSRGHKNFHDIPFLPYEGNFLLIKVQPIVTFHM